MIGGGDFDALSRSEAVVTRRIGGGRQQRWSNGTWVPFDPKPRVKVEPEPEQTAGRRPDRCKRDHEPNWFVNKNNGWRQCRTCRTRTRVSRVAAMQSDRQT